MHFTAAGKLLLESWQKLFCVFHLAILEEVSVPIMQPSGAGKKIPALASLAHGPVRGRFIVHLQHRKLFFTKTASLP